jgi:hypothetical protein
MPISLITASIVLALTGIAVGFGQGFLGVGGSFIMVPVVYWLFTAMGVSPDTALKLAFGSSLLVIFTTAVSGVLAHMQKGAVWWKAGIILGICGTIGAITGSTIASRFLTIQILRPTFGLAIGLAAVWMVLVKLPEVEEAQKGTPAIWVCWGFPVGLISGLLGFGGGIIMVPVMSMGFKLGMHRAVGTSLAMMIFTSFGGTMGYLINGLFVPGLPPFSMGYVNILAWASLALTSIPVAQLGARTAHRVPARQLRFIFIVMMFYVALKMVGVFEWLDVPL